MKLSSSARKRPKARAIRLEAFLPYRLNVLAQTVSEGLARQYSEKFGIGIPEWRIIATLGEFPEMTAKGLGAHARMHKTKVSRAVAALDARGFLVKRANDEDRRAQFLSLSEAGRRVYHAISPMALAYEADLKHGLPAEDLAAFDRVAAHLMSRVADHDV